MNMFAKNSATSIKEYISMVPENRKKDIEFIYNFIQKTVPSLKPHFASNMIGYGSFEYLDSKKIKKEWPVVSLANQKNYISIYLCATEGKQYLAEKYAKKLGDVSVGKSCVRFKKIEDLNLETLTTVLKIAEKSPGLLGANLV